MSWENRLQEPVKTELAGKLRVVVWIVSAVVLLLVAFMRSPYKFGVSREVEEWIQHLPATMAFINTLVAGILLGGLWCIFQKKYRAHQWCMTSALILSSGFLFLYVSYHFTMMETKYPAADQIRYLGEEDVAWWEFRRKLYFVLLITHIAAAAISFPLILMTFVHSWTRNFVKHRKLARITFPLWLFVTISGPICFYMIKPFYPWNTALDDPNDPPSAGALPGE